MKRFWSKVNQPSLYACWTWQAYKNPAGYGKFGIGDKVYLAHRVAYTFIKGAISKELQIDHLCRNRACVNPLHLEAVTSLENSQRGDFGTGKPRPGRVKSRCKNGHKRTPDNLESGGQCTACNRIWQRERYHAKKEKV